MIHNCDGVVCDVEKQCMRQRALATVWQFGLLYTEAPLSSSDDSGVHDLGDGGGRALAETAPQFHDYVPEPLREWPGSGLRAGAGRGSAPQHHART